ncbi:MAG: LysM peptidoglycan-binding domain-containing protein [Nitrospinota bacterium]
MKNKFLGICIFFIVVGVAFPLYAFSPSLLEYLDARKALSAEVTYDVPVVMNDRVEYFIRHFQTGGKATFTKWLRRSTKYIGMSKDILKENGLPEDLAYLALIESGYYPKAYSKAGAAGTWQFMLWTGRRYGLRVDWWIDERRDPEKATRAAAAYLTRLYDMFGSWYLAGAGYNAGEGRIRSLSRKYKTDDFWEIAAKKKGLKRETKNYIPKYLAAMIIAKDPDKYGFSDIDYSQPVTYDKVPITMATDLRVISKACGCSILKLNELNPELKRGVTPPSYLSYHVKVPKGKLEITTTNLDKIPSHKRVSFIKHKVKRGEALYTIARKYRTKIKPIMDLNNIKRASFIREGKELIVPVKAGKNSRIALLQNGIYLVKKGDTLSGISNRFGVKIDNLIEWNEIEKVDRLHPGQKIYLLKEA